tara:strand:+ start:1729 stop:2013 length:285 start_codon:yes stop_codon:yes gene_type:complete
MQKDDKETPLTVEAQKELAAKQAEILAQSKGMFDLAQRYRNLGKHHNQKGHKYPEWVRERRDKFHGCGNRTKKGLVNDKSLYKTLGQDKSKSSN